MKIDGSGRLSRRNRRFLRRFTSPSMTIPAPCNAPPPPHIQSTVDNENNFPTTTSTVPTEAATAPCTSETTPYSSDIGDTIDATEPPPEVSDPLPTPSESLATSRHRRSARKPPKYEPESGKWVYQD